MTALSIILVIYILGIIFNFGCIFEANVSNHYSVKENIIPILGSFLSWMLWPIAYIYQAIVKKRERKKLGI